MYQLKLTGKQCQNAPLNLVHEDINEKQCIHVHEDINTITNVKRFSSVVHEKDHCQWQEKNPLVVSFVLVRENFTSNRLCIVGHCLVLRFTVLLLGIPYYTSTKSRLNMGHIKSYYAKLTPILGILILYQHGTDTRSDIEMVNHA